MAAFSVIRALRSSSIKSSTLPIYQVKKHNADHKCDHKENGVKCFNRIPEDCKKGKRDKPDQSDKRYFFSWRSLVKDFTHAVI